MFTSLQTNFQLQKIKSINQFYQLRDSYIFHPEINIFQKIGCYGKLPYFYDRMELWPKLYTKLWQGHLIVCVNFFVCLKLELVQLFPLRSLLFYLGSSFIPPLHALCFHLHFWCQYCQLTRIIGQSEVSNSRDFYNSIDRLPLRWLL